MITTKPLNPITNSVQRWDYFPTSVYTTERPDFIDSVKFVADEYLEAVKKDQPSDQPLQVTQTGNFFNDARIKDFIDYVGQTGWSILNTQGYAMDNRVTFFNDMWAQEYTKYSNMEQHTHIYGTQIVGFYFYEVPENSSKVLLFDPRPGKVQINLPEQDYTLATHGSNVINFTLQPGMFMFTNSWLAHAFTQHQNDAPLKFVHFNLAIQNTNEQFTQPEVV